MHSVTCTSPSKAFNLAGLQIANIISADEYMRMKIDKAININEVCDVNPFGVEALMAAYNDGEEWLEELKHYLAINYSYLKTYFNEYLPEFPCSDTGRHIPGMGGLLDTETAFERDSGNTSERRKALGK